MKRFWHSSFFSKLKTQPLATDWGWLPAISLINSIGLLLLGFANTGARNNLPWAETLFWIGLILLFAPAAARLAAPTTISRREAIWLVVILGICLYFVKVLHSPIAFNIHDEFFHLRTTNDVLRSSHLFVKNPLLPVSALFPSMESVVAAMVSLSGLPVFVSGMILIGIARLVLVLALFLLYEEISHSAQIAGLATLLYMANPNFVFFLSTYKYETLAISLSVMALWIFVRRERGPDPSRFALTLAVIPLLALVAATHHLTSYGLTAFLLLWSVTGFILKKFLSGKEDHTPNGMALLSLVFCIAWLVFAAAITIDYLAPHVLASISELFRMIAGEPDAGRKLFGGSTSIGETGLARPLWERTSGFASVGIIMIGLASGLLVTWKRYLNRSIIIALAIASLAYPAAQVLRFTKSGWEISNRTSEFIFVALALILAFGFLGLLQLTSSAGFRAIFFGVCATIMFLGGIISGWPPTWRLPGPYLVEAGTRSIEFQGISAATWAGNFLGPDNHVGADKTNMMLMGSYGDQNISTTLSGGVDPYWILFAPRLGTDQISIIQRGKLRYLVVDRRIFTDKRVAGFFPDATANQALQKFDHSETLSRIYDSGDITIYAVGGSDSAP